MNMNYPYNPYNPYPQPKNGINWVQGMEGAKAYQLTPNSNTILLDSENEGIFYIKVCDSVGMCSLRVFKYSEVTEQPKAQTEYITRTELTDIINGLREEIKNDTFVSAIKPTAKNEQQYV